MRWWCTPTRKMHVLFKVRIQQVTLVAFIWTRSKQNNGGICGYHEQLTIRLSCVAILSVKQSQHDWQAVECNASTPWAGRSIRFTVSCGSLVISATPVDCCAVTSQWAPRALLVQTGSRGWSAGWEPSTGSQWNLSQQLQRNSVS